MESFVNGELVIMRHATHFHGWDGALGVVVGGLATRRSLDMNTRKSEWIQCYQVRPLVEGAMIVNCRPHQLRKLADPGAEKCWHSEGVAPASMPEMVE